MNTIQTRSNILGVTGMSRAALAEMFRSRGLFGRDSYLSRDEQAVVQSRLPTIAGLATRPVPVFQSPRLKALADYAEALAAGREASAERSRAIQEGLSSQSASEVAIVVDNVGVVFGAVKSAVQPAATAAPQYAKAA